MRALDVCSEPLGPQFSADDRGRHAIVITAAEVQGVIDLRALLRVGNIDATIYAESPRLGPYRIAMQHNLAGALGTKTHDVNIKFKTLEGFPALVTEKVMAAQAVATLEPLDAHL